MKKIKKKSSKTKVNSSEEIMIFNFDDSHSDTDSKSRSKKKKKSSLDGNDLKSENFLDSGSVKVKKQKKKRDSLKIEHNDDSSNGKLSPNLLSVSPTQKVTLRKYKLIENELRSKEKSILSNTGSRASKAKEMIESMYSTSPTSLAALISQSRTMEKNGSDLNKKEMKKKYRLSAPPPPSDNPSHKDQLTKKTDSFNINLLKKYNNSTIMEEEEEEPNNVIVKNVDIDNDDQKTFPKSETSPSPRNVEEEIKDNINNLYVEEVKCEVPEKTEKSCYNEHLKNFKEECIKEMRKIHELNYDISMLSSDIDELESTSQRLQTHLEITRQNAQNIGILIQDSKIKVDNSLNYIKESKKRDNKKVLLSILSLFVLLIATIVWLVSAIFMNIRLLFVQIYCYCKNEHKNNNKLPCTLENKICYMHDHDLLEELETLEDMSSSIKNLIKQNEEKDKKNKRMPLQCK